MVESHEIETISPQDLEGMIKEGKDLSIIDVREDDEIAAGKIEQAKHIRLSEIPDRLHEIDKDKEHIMVCRSGGRSGRACEFLVEQGYKVKNMVGGMLKWDGETK